MAQRNLTDRDPRFVDSGKRDFPLRPDSPALNAGMTLGEVAADLEGRPRPQGQAYDIGAYEMP
jgi:hypothetical protein